MGSQSGNPRGILKNIKIMNRPGTILAVIGILFSAFLFYWYEYRPVNIRKECYAIAKREKELAFSADNSVMNLGMEVTRYDYDKLFNDTYQDCLMKKGLEK